MTNINLSVLEMIVCGLLVMTLTVLTSNINGLHDSKKWEEFWPVIPHLDILCLQETYLISEQEYSFQLYAQGYDFWYSHGTTASAGVCVCICHALGVNTVKIGETLGHLLALCVSYEQDALDLNIICIYALTQPKEWKDFFMQLASFVTENTVLIGDFNSVTSPMDRLSGNLDSTSFLLHTFLDHSSLTKPPGAHLTSFTYHHPILVDRKS